MVLLNKLVKNTNSPAEKRIVSLILLTVYLKVVRTMNFNIGQQSDIKRK